MHKTPLVDNFNDFMERFPVGSKRRFLYADALNAQDLIDVKRMAQNAESLGKVRVYINQNYFEVEIMTEEPDDEKKTEGLPVAGYIAQTDWNISRVNANKRAEEAVLKALDGLAEMADVDKRWLAIGRTQIEQGFMAVNRSIFKPERVKLD